MQEVGKLRAWLPQRILGGHWNDMLGSKDSAVSMPETVDNRKNDGELFIWAKKKTNPHSPKPVDEQWQAPSSSRILVAGAEPKSSEKRDQTTWRIGGHGVPPIPPDHSTGGSTEGELNTVWGITSIG